jgi:hypothetical protein
MMGFISVLINVLMVFMKKKEIALLWFDLQIALKIVKVVRNYALLKLLNILAILVWIMKVSVTVTLEEIVEEN